MYGNICAKYGLKIPLSKWHPAPKVMGMTRLRTCRTSGDKLVIANQPDTVLVNKQRKKAIVIAVAIPRDGKIRKEHETETEKHV